VGSIGGSCEHYYEFPSSINLRQFLWTIKWLKNVVFWDVPLCRSCVDRRFGGECRSTQDLRSVTSQKTTFFIVTAVKASNLTN
jgi:hypothetical protein